MNIPYNGKSPSIHESVFVAPGAYLIGDVQVGKDSSIWFNAVLRHRTVRYHWRKMQCRREFHFPFRWSGLRLDH